ncbi:hypothetical protein NXH76_03795 [Blautia schinkii]|nr:hypothetical protein [Blautia schinkii]
MKVFKYIKRFLLDLNILMGYLTKLGFYNHMSDEEYLKKYKVSLGRELNLENP